LPGRLEFGAARVGGGRADTELDEIVGDAIECPPGTHRRRSFGIRRVALELDEFMRHVQQCRPIGRTAGNTPTNASSLPRRAIAY